MTQDTFHLIETIIYPWPSREDFKRAFLALDVPDDDLERARKNLHREKLREMGLAMSNDANDASDFYFKENAKQYYYAGQYPPIQIFNPFAWAKFIEAWKNGDFKRKRKKRI